MNTERLIDVLSTNVEPVRSGRIERTLVVAVALGCITAVCVMAATVSWRADLDNAATLGLVALKALFALTVSAAGFAMLRRLAYPGGEHRRPLRVIFIPFGVLGAASLVVLAITPAPAWHPMMMGTHWWLCLYCIPLFAIGPFALLIWALRSAAPTNLAPTGGIAGLVAGAIGAMAYAFHCPDDSIPFVALWYGVSIAACGLAGTWFGPRLLRW